MNFEVGKYYIHEGGRYVYIVGEVETTMWGKMTVVEEADSTGHSISCAEFDDTVDIEKNGWIEIGKEEWLKLFKDQSCDACGQTFKNGEKYVPTPKGPLHPKCFAKLVQERGPEIVETADSTIH